MTLCFRYTSFALWGQASQHISSFPTQCDTVLFPLQHLLSECSSYTIHCPFYMCQNAQGKQPFPPSRCSGSLYITPCQVLEPHCPFHRSECSRYSVLPQPCQRNTVLSPFYSVPGTLSSLLCQNAQRTLFFHNFIMLEVLYPFFTVSEVHCPFTQCQSAQSTLSTPHSHSARWAVWCQRAWVTLSSPPVSEYSGYTVHSPVR